MVTRASSGTFSLNAILPLVTDDDHRQGIEHVKALILLGTKMRPILVDHWVHEPGRPRGTVLALHGFTMGHPRIDAAVLLANHWYRRGLDVALLTLPHHGRRTPVGARFSGEHFAVPHVARLSASMTCRPQSNGRTS